MRFVHSVSTPIDLQSHGLPSGQVMHRPCGMVVVVVVGVDFSQQLVPPTYTHFQLGPYLSMHTRSGDEYPQLQGFPSGHIGQIPSWQEVCLPWEYKTSRQLQRWFLLFSCPQGVPSSHFSHGVVRSHLKLPLEYHGMQSQIYSLSLICIACPQGVPRQLSQPVGDGGMVVVVVVSGGVIGSSMQYSFRPSSLASVHSQVWPFAFFSPQSVPSGHTWHVGLGGTIGFR